MRTSGVALRDSAAEGVDADEERMMEQAMAAMDDLVQWMLLLGIDPHAITHTRDHALIVRRTVDLHRTYTMTIARRPHDRVVVQALLGIIERGDLANRDVTLVTLLKANHTFSFARFSLWPVDDQPAWGIFLTCALPHDSLHMRLLKEIIAEFDAAAFAFRP